MPSSDPSVRSDKFVLSDLGGVHLGAIEFNSSLDGQHATAAQLPDFAHDVFRDFTHLKRWALDRNWRIPSLPAFHIAVSDRFEISRSLAPAWFGCAGYMEFPAWRVMARKAAIAHELVHVLFPNGNRFLAEGLAVYLQDEIGGNPAFPNFGRPLHLFARAQMSDMARDFLSGDEAHGLLDLSSLDAIPTPRPLTRRVGRDFLGEEPRGQALIYALAGSFAQFLIESRGHAAFRKLYERTPLIELQQNAGSLGRWKDVYGISLSDLAREWKGLIAHVVEN